MCCTCVSLSPLLSGLYIVVCFPYLVASLSCMPCVSVSAVSLVFFSFCYLNLAFGLLFLYLCQCGMITWYWLLLLLPSLHSWVILVVMIPESYVSWTVNINMWTLHMRKICMITHFLPLSANHLNAWVFVNICKQTALCHGQTCMQKHASANNKHVAILAVTCRLLCWLVGQLVGWPTKIPHFVAATVRSS